MRGLVQQGPRQGDKIRPFDFPSGSVPRSLVGRVNVVVTEAEAQPLDAPPKRFPVQRARPNKHMKACNVCISFFSKRKDPKRRGKDEFSTRSRREQRRALSNTQRVPKSYLEDE